MIVVDTNIVAYLLIEGDMTHICRQVFTLDPEWAAPLLWRSEFRNVLTAHMRRAGMSLDAAIARMALAEKLLANREYAIQSDSILRLTARRPISAYDAEFVLLAAKLGTQLVSMDQALLKEFPEIATDPNAFVLKD